MPKRCSLCLEEKELTAFSTAGSSIKFHARCKPCRARKQNEAARSNPVATAARNKRWRIQPENAARLRDSSKAWVAANPERALLNSLRSRAKKLGIEFDLELGDIEIPEFCPVLGLRLSKSHGRMTDCSPSVDRINSRRGYVRGNIAVISWRANSLKKDGSLSELRAIVAWLEKQ